MLRSISNIIVGDAYYPGSTSEYAPNKEDIILHITETVHNLYNRYANPLFVIMGEFNDLKINARPVSLTSHIMKIFERVIKKRDIETSSRK